MTDGCRMCLEPLPDPRPGQKRRYCDEECRRRAEMELRHLRRSAADCRERLERLEQQIQELTRP